MISMIILIGGESNMAKKIDDEYYRLLEQIQAADFVLVELTLYLDTHPHDRLALQQFHEYSRYSKQLRKRFEPEYGPLLQYGVSQVGAQWDWSRGPWPWQV